MRATIIKSIEELDAVKTNAVVFAFRPSMRDMLAITAKRRIKVIQINPGADRSLAVAVRELLAQKKILCLTGSIQGIRKDKHGNTIDIKIPQEAENGTNC